MTQKRDNLGWLLAGALVTAVVGGSVAGLMVIGGPGEARTKKIDTAKLQLLINVETQLYCHYLAEDEFPVDQASLERLMTNGVESDEPEKSTMIEQACGRSRYTSRYATNLPDEGFDYRLTEDRRPEVCVEFGRSPREPKVSHPFRARTMFAKLSDLPDTPGRHCFVAPANPLSGE